MPVPTVLGKAVGAEIRQQTRLKGVSVKVGCRRKRQDVWKTSCLPDFLISLWRNLAFQP